MLRWTDLLCKTLRFLVDCRSWGTTVKKKPR